MNPWNRPLPVHTYDEYEDEFRERMRDAGLPLEHDGPAADAPAPAVLAHAKEA